MKPSDFYEGNTPVHGIITTGEITDIADPSVDFMDAYYMGYISFFNLPENIKFHNVNQVGGSLQIINQFDRNHAWGFCKSARATGGSSYSDVLVPYNGSLYNKRSGTVEPRLYNSIEMARFANANWLFITLRYIFIPSSDLDSNNSAYNNRQSNGSYTMQTVTCYLPVIGANIDGVDYSGFNDFMTGNSQLDFGTATLNGDSVSLTFNFDDFGDDSNPTCKREVTAGASSFTLFAQITSFGFYDRGEYLYENSSYNEPCVPFIEFDNLIENQGVKTMAVGTSSDFTQMYINLDSRTGNYILSSGIGSNYIVNNWYQGNFYIENDEMDGGSTGSEYWYASLSRYSYPGLSRDGIIRGRHITDYRSISENNFFIYTFMRPIDIWLSIIMYHKIDTLHKDDNTVVPINTYTDDYSVTIYFDNVPTTDRVQESFSSIETKLMDWQKPNVNIYDDEFDIADMPIEPVPPPEPGNEDSMSGVDWLLNNTLPFGSTAGFVTQYVITGSQLQNFSNALWATFDNPDFWKSIGTVLSTSLSIDPSEILKFIVSLRMYPCTVPSSSSGGSDIYFGRGFVPISVGSGVVKVTGDYTFSLTTGWAGIPTTFKDFRDYEPYTRVTVILPFCGAIELTPSQVVGKEIRATYLIDTSNGTCSAALEVRGSKQYVIGTYEGNIAAQIQMSASNLGQIFQKGVGATVGVAQTAGMILVGEAAASSSAEASLAGATETSEMNKIMTTYQNKLASTYAGGVSSYIDNVKGIGNVPCSRFGQSTGFSNYLNTTPMIRIETRFYEIPTNYAHVYGYACNKTVKLDDLSGKGFTVCKNVDLEGVPATQDELAILEQLLQTGVYL